MVGQTTGGRGGTCAPKASRRLILAVLGLGAVTAFAAGGPALASAAPEGDLAVRVSDSPDPVDVGALLTYTIKVKNLGPDTATGVTVTDELPAGVKFVSATPSSCHRTGRTITCNVGALASADTVTVRVEVRPQKAGKLTDTASVQSKIPDPVAANNQDTATTTVMSPPPPGRPACAGQRATITGTPGNDTLIGTAGRDVIVARGGDDTIKAHNGQDAICAGRGDDLVSGGRKADTIKGGRGGDTLRGRRGNDHLFGNRGADLLVGGRGFDSCVGDPGKDVVRSCEA
jgi:uncharacterized repeat protein (TIGR01451 family)